MRGPSSFWINNTQSSGVLIYPAGEVVLNTIYLKRETPWNFYISLPLFLEFHSSLFFFPLWRQPHYMNCRKQHKNAGPCQAVASCDSCSTWRHCCLDRHSWRHQVDSVASFTQAQGPAHCPSVIYPSLTLSDAPPPPIHFDPTTLNPPSTRRHGRQSATQTGDCKQLINMVTPLHLPGPTWGGELSASKTKQPSTHVPV